MGQLDRLELALHPSHNFGLQVVAQLDLGVADRSFGELQHLARAGLSLRGCKCLGSALEKCGVFRILDVDIWATGNGVWPWKLRLPRAVCSLLLILGQLVFGDLTHVA